MKRIKKQKPTAATAPADTHDDRVDVCRDCALKAYSRAQSELLGAIEGVNLIANDNKETREVCGAILLYLTAAKDSRPELSASFSSREEAIDQGRATADELGSQHIVEDAEPTGAPTDEG